MTDKHMALIGNDDPLTQLVSCRHTGLSSEQLVARRREYWQQYGEDLGALGRVAADAVLVLREQGPWPAMDHIAKSLGTSMFVGEPSGIMAVFGEIHDAIVNYYMQDSPSRDRVYALLVCLMRLGRVPVVPLQS